MKNNVRVLRRATGILLLIFAIMVFPIIEIARSYLKSDVHDQNYPYASESVSFISKDEKNIFQYGLVRDKDDSYTDIRFINKYDLEGKLIVHKIIEEENQRNISSMDLLEGDTGLYVYLDIGGSDRFVYTLDENLNVTDKQKIENYLTFKNYGEETLAIENSVITNNISIFRMKTEGKTELLFTLPWENYFKFDFNGYTADRINIVIHKVNDKKIYATFTTYQKQILTSITECFDYSGNSLWRYERTGCVFKTLEIINDIIYVGGTDINYNEADKSYISVPVVCSLDANGKFLSENKLTSDGFNSTVTRIFNTNKGLVIIGGKFTTQYYSENQSNDKKFDIRYSTDLNGTSAAVYIGTNHDKDVFYINEKFITHVDIYTEIQKPSYPVIKTYDSYDSYLNTIDFIGIVTYVYKHRALIIISCILLTLILNFDLLPKRKPIKIYDDN